MTIPRPAALDALEETARTASAAESAFRDNYAREIARLETERRRAYRRLNFLAALVAADAEAGDRDASRAVQRAVALQELDWQENDAAIAEVLDALTPLADAIFDERALEAVEAEETLDPGAPKTVSTAEPGAAHARAGAILFALAAFEERFEALRGKPFAELFDRSFPDTPLVDF